MELEKEIMDPINEIRKVYEETIRLKEIARKSVGSIDAYLEAAQYARQAGEMSRNRVNIESDIDIKSQHEVFAAYYFYEEQDCLSGYHYEKRNTDDGREHANRGATFIERAIALIENVPPEVSEEVRERLLGFLPAFNHYRRTIRIKMWAHDARAAWDKALYVKALDVYRRMGELQQEDLEALTEGVAPQYHRIARGNFIGYMVNASSAMAQAMLQHREVKDRENWLEVPADLAIRLLKYTLDAYMLANAAFEENPEWEQYRDNGLICLGNIQSFLRSNPEMWLKLYISFEDNPEFLKIMKMTDLPKFKETETKRHLQENKYLKLWAVGGFWLVALLAVVAMVLLLQSSVAGFWRLALVMVTTEVILLIVGGLVLRTMGDLSEKNFIELIGMALRYQFKFLQLKKRDESE